ncbi:fukutin-like isoform X1 [Centruroides sculpturatus]|uniref:fukutin-like isoform X1 n=1 Tax=Centruroides sculpturatus TaxID=218467 RepID=UPI000C6EE211|nr:fukutin-like isoform X1 [Centruroides sculpturatus]
MKSSLSQRVVFILIIFGIAGFFYLSIPSLEKKYLQTIKEYPHVDYNELQKIVQAEIQQIDLTFLKTLQDSGIQVFLIEPRLLLYFLNEDDLKILEKREVRTKHFYERFNITSYGIFENSSNSINDNVVSLFEHLGYRYYKEKSLDFREIHWDENRSQSLSITSHHFFIKNYRIIHLVVFFNRNTYFWNPKLENVPEEVQNILLPSELSYGTHASAFERFEVIPSNSTIEQTIYVPSDLTYFLFEIPSSNFHECNFVNVKTFFSNNEYENDAKFDDKVRRAIETLKVILKPFYISFWIGSGTLLGWYRQCGVIPYTSDVDFAIWIRDFDTDLDKYMKKQKFMKLKYVFGVPEESYQYAFYLSKLRIDLFFTYKGPYNYWYGGHMPSSKKYFHYIYPKFVLCSAELLKQKILIPCTTEEIIIAEYGYSWMKPIKRWNYDESAYNIGPKLHWPDKYNHTFIVY